MDLFQNAAALHARAMVHITEMERQAEEYLALHRYRVFLEPDGNSGQMLAKIALEEPIPLSLSCVAFDAINCLRSALDHSVYAASVTLDPNAEPKSIKFPFGDTEDAVKGEFRGKAKGVPAALQEHLLRLKPYEAGNRALWGLNQIRNLKVHRMLAPAALGGAMGIGNGRVTIRFVYRWDGDKDELTFAELPVGAWEQFDKSISVAIAFGEGTPFPRKEVARVLRHLLGVTEGVLKGIKTETARLLRERAG